MSLKNLARRMFLRALRPASGRQHTRPLGRLVERLEDRVVPSLVNYYPADSNVLDNQGTNHGTLNNGAGFTTGLIGAAAFRFDGVNDTVTVARQVQNDFSLAAWVRTTGTAGGTNFYDGDPVITSEVAGVTNDFGTTLLNGKFAFGVGNPDQTIVSTTAVNDGAWHHVAATRQGNTIRVYVDGKLENSLAAANGGALSAGGTITIGGDAVNSRYLPGAIDDVRVYNHALTAAEVSNLGLASIGAAIDDGGERLMLFNPTTGTQTGVVSIPGGALWETVIDPQGKFAYVADFNGAVRVVDLTTQALASGINAIAVPNAEDLVLTADGKYLLVVDGSNLRPITVIDTATRSVVSVLNEGIHHIGIDVTATGDVLSSSGGASRRYTLSPAGVLTFTGQTVAGAGLNVTAAPNGLTAVQTDLFGGFSSFVIAGMSSVTTLTTGGLGRAVSAAFSPDGTRLYVRTPNNLLGYTYNPATGAIGGQLFNVGGFPTASAFFGVDQLDVTPTRVYTPVAGGVGAFDALTGANLGSMTVPGSAFVGVDTVLGVVAPPSPTDDFGDSLPFFGIAQHTAFGVRLGASRDAEYSSYFNGGPGFYFITADGDDTHGIDDEDGVTLSQFVPNQTGTAAVSVQNVTGTAYLQGWIDWNRDLTFGAGEQIATNVPFSANGTVTLSFTVPSLTTAGSTFARFRISTTSGLGPTGAAIDGEVEDYPAYVPFPTVVYASPTFTTPGAVVDGDLTAPGLQPATVGYNAFATVTAAIGRVQSSGTVILNTAVYPENVVTDRFLLLQSYDATVDSLTASDNVALRGTLHAGGPLSFISSVQILGDVTLDAGGDVTFQGGITNSFSDPGPGPLTVKSPGTTTFGSSVFLDNLTTDAGGSTILSQDVYTTYDQFFGDAVILTGDISLFSSFGNVTFASTVDDSLQLRYSLSTPAFNFIDVSATGTPGPTSGFETLTDVPIGFTFDFYGVPTDLVSVSSNGVISLSNFQDSFFPGYGLPDYISGALVAGWWAELDPGSGGEIRYETVGAPGSRVFIVQWTAVEYSGNPGFPVTFQIQLHEGTNAIEIHLPDANSDGYYGHTVGIQDHTSTKATTAYYGTAPLPPDTAFRFTPAIVPAQSTLSVSAPGTTTFGGAVGGVLPLGSLTLDLAYIYSDDIFIIADGATVLAAGSITTSGAQLYRYPVTVGADTTLTSTAGGIEFSSTLDGPAGLTLNTGGVARFIGAVGAADPLAFLTTDAGGTTVVDGGSIRTTGPQVYNDQFNLGAATTVTSTAGGITFNGPLDTGHTPVETLTNGSFETGDFTGWTTLDVNNSLYPLSVVGAGVNGGVPYFFDSAPTDGDFAAFNAYDYTSDPGLIRLAQEVTIPANAFRAILTFDYSGDWDNVYSFYASFDDPLTVKIETPGGTVLLSTRLGGPFPPFIGGGVTGATFSVDLSAFIGQTVVVAFDQVIPPDVFPYGQVQIDNVRLLADLPAAPRNLTVNSGGATTFNAVVGGARPLGTLSVTAGGNLTVGAAVTTTGAATLAFGQDNAGRTATISGAIHSATAAVTGGGGSDAIIVNATASAPVFTVNGAGGGDTYFVNAGAAQLGTVAIADTGASGTDAAVVTGTAVGDTFNVNNTAVGARTVTVSNGGKVTYSTPITLERLTLSGGGGGDTYNISYANPLLATSALPTEFVRVNAGGGSDIAIVTATSIPDAINVNSATARRVTSAGQNVDYTTALEALVVNGGDETGLTGDTFTVTPDSPTAITIHGGNPVQPTFPGDTLLLNAANLTGAAITPTPALPNGTLTSNKATVSWTGIETFPTPLGFGGSFDFEINKAQVQPGWFSVLPSDTVASGAYSFANVGWVTSPNGYDRNGTNGYFPPAGPLSNLYRDGAWGGQGTAGQRDFRVAVQVGQPLQITALMGDVATINDHVDILVSSDGVNFTLLNPAPDTFQNSLDKGFKYLSYSAEYTPTSTALTVRIRDNAGNLYWTIAGLDVRPISLRTPITLTRADANGSPVEADGLTVDTYNGIGAPGATLVTVAPQYGTPVGADADPALAGFQVTAAADGSFTFQVRRSTGFGPAVITASDVGGGSQGTFSQAYFLPAVRRIDFGPTGSPVAVGEPATQPYVGVADEKYVSRVANAMGWVGPVTAVDRGTGSALQRDIVYGTAVLARDFRINMPTAGATYFVTVILGDPSFARDGMFVSVVDPADPLTVLSTPVTGVSTPAGQSVTRTFTATADANGEIRLRFGDNAGDSYWTVQALEVRPTQGTITISGASAVLANGTTVTGYSLAGATANSLVTVAVEQGTIVSTDDGPSYVGFQVLTDSSGAASFLVKSTQSTSNVTSAVAAAEVTGASVSSPFVITYTGTGGGGGGGGGTTAFRFDFNGAANDKAAGFLGVRGNQTFNATTGYGWSSAVTEFERTLASVTAKGVSATQAPLYRDGAYGSGKGVFRVAVTPGEGTPAVPGSLPLAARIYVGDSYTNWPYIVLTVEGNTGGPIAVNTSTTPFGSYVLTGTDANADGKWDITISSSYIWVVNGIDVASGGSGNLPALPQAAVSSASRPEGEVVSGSVLAPVVAAAIDRLAAAGNLSAVQIAQLQAVRFEVGNLSGGHLGEHFGGLVRLDADAGGRGWFVDATPMDDAEFTPTSETQGIGGRGYDLLTVVMHELSHELGAIDLGAAVEPDSLMTESLDAGVRRLPNGGAWALSVGVPSVTPVVANRVSGYLWLGDEKVARTVTVSDRPAAVVIRRNDWGWSDAAVATAGAGWPVPARTDVLALHPDWFGDGDLGGVRVG